MELEQVQELAEQVDSEVVENTIEQEEKEQKAGKPAGYDTIDPSKATPEEVTQRLNYLYKQFKTSDEKYRTTEKDLRSYREIAEQQAKMLEELQNGVGAVVDHLQTKTFADSEAQLKAQYREAVVAGDVDAQIEINDKLLELKAKKLNAPKPQPKKQEVKQQIQPQDDFDPDAYYDGREVVEAWQDERDANGQLLRPWAINRGSATNPSPQYKAAETILFSVLGDSQYANKTMEEKLKIVDERMGLSRKEAGQTVMGGRLTMGSKNAKIKLQPEVEKYAEQIAIRTGFGGSKAKNDAERIQLYKQQLVNVKSKRS